MGENAIFPFDTSGWLGVSISDHHYDSTVLLVLLLSYLKMDVLSTNNERLTSKNDDIKEYLPESRYHYGVSASRCPKAD